MKKELSEYKQAWRICNKTKVADLDIYITHYEDPIIKKKSQMDRIEDMFRQLLKNQIK
jgi:hypothetical protein